ncbi:MAG: hypothetical protein ACPG4K_06970, partial [Haloferula sp.]
MSMIIAERNKDGSYTPIDFLEQPAPLARDIFRFGRITRSTTERIVEILQGLQVDSHGDNAVATAGNGGG